METGEGREAGCEEGGWRQGKGGRQDVRREDGDRGREGKEKEGRDEWR